MGREKNLFSDTCEASCLAAASLCAEESAAYVRDVYRLPSTYVREAVSAAGGAREGGGVGGEARRARGRAPADGRRSGRGAGLTVTRLMVDAL